MKRNRLPAALLAGLVLAGCQSQSQITGPKLSAAEVRAAIVGNTQHARSINYDFIAYFAANGTAKYRSTDATQTGTWKITDDGQLCTDFKLGGSDQGCTTVFGKDGTYTFIRPNGVVYATATMTQGNVDGL